MYEGRDSLLRLILAGMPLTTPTQCPFQNSLRLLASTLQEATVTYPTLGKGKSSSKVPCDGIYDMLVPWKSNKYTCSTSWEANMTKHEGTKNFQFPTVLPRVFYSEKRSCWGLWLLQDFRLPSLGHKFKQPFSATQKPLVWAIDLTNPVCKGKEHQLKHDTKNHQLHMCISFYWLAFFLVIFVVAHCKSSISLGALFLGNQPGNQVTVVSLAGSQVCLPFFVADQIVTPWHHFTLWTVTCSYTVQVNWKPSTKRSWAGGCKKDSRWFFWQKSTLNV